MGVGLGLSESLGSKTFQDLGTGPDHTAWGEPFAPDVEVESLKFVVGNSGIRL
jgi:hypothetical protein